MSELMRTAPDSLLHLQLAAVLAPFQMELFPIPMAIIAIRIGASPIR